MELHMLKQICQLRTVHFCYIDHIAAIQYSEKRISQSCLSSIDFGPLIDGLIE